ncbi:MAG TPA: DUF2459 domain-containing protein [Acetobacteraceae bacterium]|nr:DUF2459 domain-containing protein [Acetobacteraceae bacterium]
MDWKAARRRIAGTAVGFLASVPLLGCTPPIGDVGRPGPDVVYAIDRGWHTDVGLPVDEIHGALASLEPRFPGVRYFTFGFGERQFYMSRRADLIESLSALLPSQSALLVTGLIASPQMAFGVDHVVVLHVTGDGVTRIENAIWQELDQSPAGAAVFLANGPYEGSAFYAARGTYDAFNTCNTWTAEMLRAGGLPFSAAGVMFSGQVMGMARAIAVRQASL